MNRNRALIISYFRYHPHVGESYRVMWEAWLKNFEMWAKEVDAFYLIDQEMNFTQYDYARLTKILPNSTIIKSEVASHHWGQFKAILPKIKEENMLFLDNDVVIQKPGVVDGWFKWLESGLDFVGSFDGSGGLKELIQEKYPEMKALNATRMGSYYFLLTRNLLNKIGDFDWSPITYSVGTYLPELDYHTKEGDWSDSFGRFTLQMLGIDAKMGAIADPRHSIYLQDDGTILKDPEEPKNLGYYHIRNGNLANYIMTSKVAGNEADYQREIHSVRREILRILAWFYWMDSELKHWDQVEGLLTDLKVSEELWNNYMEEFVKYHNL